MRRMVIAAALVLAAACGGGDSNDTATAARPPATTTSTSTTAPVSPEDAFSADIARQITGGAGFDQQALDMAAAVCDMLDLTYGPTQVDPADQDQLADYQLGTIVDLELDDQVTAVVMRTGSKHLCPAHSATVGAFLLQRGL